MSIAGVKDVAARAGVSLGTVSNVLNRPHLVAEGTRRRVLDAIAELGYVRNDHARQLRAGSSRSLGYVVLDASNPFFTDVARGVEEAAQEAGLSVYLCNSNDDPQRESGYLDLLLEQRVQGVLITPVEADAGRLSALTGRGIPVILVDRGAPGAELCSVAVDDVLGGELAATHLAEAGHRRIAFVGGPFALPQVTDRRDGAQRALAGKAELIVLETTHMTVAEGRRAAERMAGLPVSRRPTAAFCANDLLALGFLQQLLWQGIDVPGGVAIVGYDDIAFAEAAAVPLTSVRQPRHLLGRAAAELLLEEVDGVGHAHRQVVFEPELIVRASSVRRRPGNHGS
jgi:LacI family transcriptional regulator